ncbi:sigma 54-interacting transcriptional regulator [Salsuginibacillus kocurii]|uniref:sigma 54-interacting transcriptional regulator n=1 Tax=Salsuginibacillus kocurii TaxID=427078 RepID=UPI00036DDEB0|nr:sigma 54-interacting transcriptional regulator [Salsuginibacillus kocurii]
MDARELVNKNEHTLNVSSTIKEAAAFFYNQPSKRVIVLKGNKEVAGILTQQHLLTAMSNGTLPTEPISTLKLERPVLTSLTAPLDGLLFDKEVYPVVNDDGAFVGTIKPEQLLEAYVKEGSVWQEWAEASGLAILLFDESDHLFAYTSSAGWLVEATEAKAQIKSAYRAYFAEAFQQVRPVFLPEQEEEWSLQVITLSSGRKGVFVQRKQPLLEAEEASTKTETLETIFETLYDGIVMTDSRGYVTMISNEYADFLNKRVENMVGKHCTEVIENSRMHIVAETGEPEIADLQKIHGDYMIATRVPIRKNGVIIGAAGKVLFKNVKGFNALHKRIHKMETELKRYRGEIEEQNQASYRFEDIIGESTALQQTKQMAKKAAKTESNLLLLGESGTGKELFAHAIHLDSPRSLGSFVKVNCAAIPADLLEAELFGYVEGAFTGAKKGGKTGKFEAADGGTIFLDEIGDLPLHMQVKFLRVLQEREVEKIGSSSSQKIDVRIVAATNRHLEQMVEDGDFRLDLYYRLHVVPIQIPPLRDRQEDISFLLNYFITKVSARLAKTIKGIDDKVKRYLLNYNWPGNIRELENVIERAINMVDEHGTIQTHHLPEKIVGKTPEHPTQSEVLPLSLTVQRAENEAIKQAMEVAKGNKSKTAQLLNISRTSLYEKLANQNKK